MRFYRSPPRNKRGRDTGHSGLNCQVLNTDHTLPIVATSRCYVTSALDGERRALRRSSRHLSAASPG